MARLRGVSNRVTAAAGAKRLVTRALNPLARFVNRVVLTRRYRSLATKVRPLPVPDFEGPLLLVFPHVDDEVIALGGLLMAWQRHGIAIDLVYTTDSSAGGTGHTPEERAATRLAEAQELQRCTGIRSVTVLSGVNEKLIAARAQVTRELSALIDANPYEAVFAVGPVDAHHEHRTSAALIADALLTASFTGSVFVGENSSFLPGHLITHAAALTRAQLGERDHLFEVFASQTSMGFEVYHDVARSQRPLAPGAHAAELFHQTDAAGLKRLCERVEASGPEDALRHRIGNSWSLWKVLRQPDPGLPPTPHSEEP